MNQINFPARNEKGQHVSPNPIDHFNANYAVDPETGCWNWTGAMFETGYGSFKNRLVNGGLQLAASRAAWVLFRGPLTRTEFVCHHCDNRRCVNLDHLFVGTSSDNMQDCSQKGRINRGEDRPQHKLTEDNVRELRSLRQRGWSWEALKNRYGVAENSVRSAALGKTWKHVDAQILTVKFGSGRRRAA